MDVSRAYRAAYDDLHLRARRFTRCPERADDIVQDAFANTLAAIEAGNHVNDVHAWLRSCVHNLGVNYATRRKDTELLSENLAPLDSGSVTAAAATRERCREILDVLGDLTPEQRRAFVLAELRGLDYVDIAADLNRSVDAARHLVCRARQRIRKSVGADDSLAVIFGLDIYQSLWPRLTRRLAQARGYVAQKISSIQATISSLTSDPEVPFQPAALAVAAILAAGISGAGGGNQVQAVGAPQRHVALSTLDRSPDSAARPSTNASLVPQPRSELQTRAPGGSCADASFVGSREWNCSGQSVGGERARSDSERTAPAKDDQGISVAGRKAKSADLIIPDAPPSPNGETSPGGVPPTGGDGSPGGYASPPPNGGTPPQDGAPPTGDTPTPPTGTDPPQDGVPPTGDAPTPPSGAAPPPSGASPSGTDALGATSPSLG